MYFDPGSVINLAEETAELVSFFCREIVLVKRGKSTTEILLTEVYYELNETI